MTDGTVHLVRDGPIARITFDRPQARNAMTWGMYQLLGDYCVQLAGDDGVRVVVFRGAGGKAFVAGTDIAQFLDFKSGDDGMGYEEQMEAILGALEKLPMPTLAVVEGYAIGGGLAIAACCDFCIATPGSRFGVPIARTLGNCLSVANTARLVAALGVPRTKRVLMLAELINADEALAGGFLTEIVPPEDIDRRVAELTDRLVHHAPITMRVAKEAIRRLVLAGLPGDEDLIRAAYGSDDFRRGVRAFVDKQEPQWTGR
jgi:enoyl-CoA hydratase